MKLITPQLAVDHPSDLFSFQQPFCISCNAKTEALHGSLFRGVTAWQSAAEVEPLTAPLNPQADA